MDAIAASSRRRLLLLAAATAAAGYGLYRLYHYPSVSRHRRRLAVLLGIAVSSADSLSLLSSDLSAFLRSDSDQIPQSLKQLAKISRSDDFAAAASRLAESLTRGVLRALGSTSEFGPVRPFSDRLLDRLLSPSGSGFASAVVGSFAHNFALAYFSAVGGATAGEPVWLRMLSSDKGKEAAAELVRTFVSTAVSVYLDRTMAVNTCDEILSSITNPKYEAKVQDLVVSVCNGAVETLVRTSRQTIAAPNSVAPAIPDNETNRIVPREAGKVASWNEKVCKDGWVNRVSTSLAVPSNRRLVLDVTGRVTAETVRSFLDFLSQRVSDGARKSIGAARDEVVERGLVAVKYLGAKSMAIFTVCLALCVHVSVGTRLLMSV